MCAGGLAELVYLIGKEQGGVNIIFFKSRFSQTFGGIWFLNIVYS